MPSAKPIEPTKPSSKFVDFDGDYNVDNGLDFDGGFVD